MLRYVIFVMLYFIKLHYIILHYIILYLIKLLRLLYFFYLSFHENKFYMVILFVRNFFSPSDIFMFAVIPLWSLLLLIASHFSFFVYEIDNSLIWNPRNLNLSRETCVRSSLEGKVLCNTEKFCLEYLLDWKNVSKKHIRLYRLDSVFQASKGKKVFT